VCEYVRMYVYVFLSVYLCVCLCVSVCCVFPKSSPLQVPPVYGQVRVRAQGLYPRDPPMPVVQAPVDGRADVAERLV
jgi:hypothetical protein